MTIPAATLILSAGQVAILAARMGGLRGQIVAAAGAACGPVAFLAVDSVVVDLAAAVSAVDVSL